jgi:hypothetical protein
MVFSLDPIQLDSGTLVHLEAIVVMEIKVGASISMVPEANLGLISTTPMLAAVVCTTIMGLLIV